LESGRDTVFIVAASEIHAIAIKPAQRWGTGQANIFKQNNTMMDSFLSIFPMGLFGHNNNHHQPMKVAPQSAAAAAAAATAAAAVEGRKRPREEVDPRQDDESGGSSTPTLIATASTRRVSEVPSFREEDDLRPIKRFCGPSGVALSPSVVLDLEKKTEASKPAPLSNLPEDVVAHCLSFLSSTEDRFALQCTSKQFNRISNADEMLIGIQVGGDCSTGMHGIVQDEDTPDTAANKFMPFAMAGNLEAVYM